MSEGLNKTLLKKFAVESKEELVEKIKLQARRYEITQELSDKDRETKGKESFISNDDVIIEGNKGSRTLSNSEKIQRTELIKKIQRINKEGRDGFDEVIEEVAYTWFNRFVALRYMEVNRFLPSRINILGSKDNTNTPEVLTEAMNVSLPIDRELVYELKKANNNEELYRYLIELQCSELNKTLPFIFEKVGHFAELLFPAGIIMSKFFRTLVDTESITEEAWSNVEIIGWLYQYYISKEKDRVIKAKKKYKKNEIPFATQLFTPDWIVRYMVQNSLGRYWVESHEEDSDLKENWEFYLENPEKEPDFDEKIAPYINKELNVEDIKCFDPACGSGHILVYMFDVLYEIYTKCGYSKGEISMLIIEKNLYGLDIDMRAYQLACFAVIMKGMSYDKLLLKKIGREVDSREKYIDLNIACVKETNILFEDEEITLHDNIAFLANEQSGETYDKVKLFVESLKNANTFGSLTKVEGFDKEFLENKLEEIKNNPAIDMFTGKSSELWKSILEDLIKQSSIMEKTYDVLVTNPPYIGNSNLNEVLGEFIGKNYIDFKADIFSAFIDYARKKILKNGMLGFMTPYVWMFTISYENLRKVLINKNDISTFIQLEYSGFDGATVPICTFTMRGSCNNIEGEYIKLSEFKGAKNQPIKVLEAVQNKVDYRFRISNSKFKAIKGYPIAFWISDTLRDIFSKNKSLGELFPVGQGLKTGDNKKFLRQWFEVDITNINKECKTRKESELDIRKWYPYANGGAYRKWYGNIVDVVNWEKDGNEIRNFYDEKGKLRSRLQNMDKYFKEGISWSAVTSKKLSLRYVPNNNIYGGAGYGIYVQEDQANYLLGLLNSIIPEICIGVLSETLNFEVGNIKRVPLVFAFENEVINLVKENIAISKYDWDSKEISIDFKINNILKEYRREEKSIKSCIDNLNKMYKNQIKRLKKNEERLNEIFIEAYGVKGEAYSMVSKKDITLSCNLDYSSKKKIEDFIDESNKIQIKDLISYFIGCILGRYSIDKERSVLGANMHQLERTCEFMTNDDNIIPILNDGSIYLNSDIIDEFEEFLSIFFGSVYKSENIDFIASVIGKKGNESSKDVIRRYLVNEFFGNHCNMYGNRPIYWLFTSGKSKAFNCLVYQHRIDKNLLSKMRIDYVQPLQNKLDTEFKDLTDTMNSDAPAKDKKDAKKKLNLVEKQIAELKVYQEKLKHMADKQIEIDLDDGVIYNHGLFGDLVAKIK